VVPYTRYVLSLAKMGWAKLWAIKKTQIWPPCVTSPTVAIMPVGSYRGGKKKQFCFSDD
jgi:hypothetical protein